QAEQEQQVIGAVEDMEESSLDEAEGGLIPARVEADQAGVAGKFEAADRAVGQDIAQNGDDAKAEAAENGVDREIRGRRLDGIFEQHVHERLVPDDIGVLWQHRTLDVSERSLVRPEG